MKKLILLTVFLLVGLASFAQRTPMYDVHLKNGSIFVGKVHQFSSDTVKVEIYGGSLFVIPRSEVTLIKRHEGGYVKKFKNVKPKGDYKVKLEGNYYIATVNYISGRNSANSIIPALGVDLIAGKQLNQKLGVGFGTGYYNFDMDLGYQILPVFAEARGYLLDKPASPFYAVSAGYGFALKDERYNVTNGRGGIYFSPSIGVRFPTRSNAAFIMDFGYTFQKAKYTSTIWNGEQIDDILFRRASLRLGIIF